MGETKTENEASDKVEKKEKHKDEKKKEELGEEKTKDKKKKKQKDKDGQEGEEGGGDGHGKDKEKKKKKNPEDKKDPTRLKQKLEKIELKLQEFNAKKEEILKLIKEAEQNAGNSATATDPAAAAPSS